MNVGRVIARPFVGRAGRVQAHREPPRLRAAARGDDAARCDDGGRPHRPRHRQDRRSVRAAAASPRPSTRRATRTGWRRSRRRSPPPVPGWSSPTWSTSTRSTGTATTPAGYAANLERFDARLARAAAAPARARPPDHHRRPRQRSDDAEHRSRARVRAGVPRRRAASRPAPTSASAHDVRRSRPDDRRDLRRRPARPRRPASFAISCGESRSSGGRVGGVGSSCSGVNRRFESSSRSASTRSWRRSRRRATPPRGGCGPRPRIRSGRRSSATAIASSTARRSAG